jgi:prepilin signal peptidase PulO-like enzyme (type II secretory pathway)
MSTFVRERKADIIFISCANFGMLLFGYLAEIGAVPRPLAAVIGFAFLYASFSVIYTNYASRSALGRKLFIFLAVIWALYGVAFLLPVVQKNIAYNCLDIVAKNFFGLYLFFKVLEASKKLKEEIEYK